MFVTSDTKKNKTYTKKKKKKEKKKKKNQSENMDRMGTNERMGTWLQSAPTRKTLHHNFKVNGQ